MATRDPDPPQKRPTGRPPHAPNDHKRESVRMWVVGGYTQESIADVMNIDVKTLRLHYRNELNLGKATIDAMATMTIVKKMLGETTVTNEKGVASKIYDHEEADSDLLKFYAARRMGWKEPKQEIAHSGAVGSFDMSKLTDEEVDRITETLERAVGRSTDMESGADEAEE